MQSVERDSGRTWVCRGCVVPLRHTLVMGIVNVTPDSFSDGGKWFDEERAVAHALDLVEEGADILDIGGESTRPGAEEVSTEEETRRVAPVIRMLAERSGVPVTVDTRHAAVARAALEAGACAVNAVQPFTEDAEMVRLVRDSGAGVVLMHMRGTPRTMSDLTEYRDVVGEVEAMLRDALACAVESGIGRERILLDPGIGFVKDTAHSVALLAATARLSRLGPLLVGASRKRFVGEVCGEPDARERVGGSVGAAVWCALHGAAVVRVHDVKATRQALAMVRRLAEATVGETHV